VADFGSPRDSFESARESVGRSWQASMEEIESSRRSEVWMKFLLIWYVDEVDDYIRMGFSRIACLISLGIELGDLMSLNMVQELSVAYLMSQLLIKQLIRGSDRALQKVG